MKTAQYILMIWVSLTITSNLFADQIVHKFKSPSFSGIGQSSHYLTIENQQKSRRDKIQEDIESAIAKAEREADSTTHAKFLRNLESRIYAQISKQLVDQMFGDGVNEGSIEGFFDMLGNTVAYELCTGCGDDGIDVIRITITGDDNTTTTLDVPVGSGAF
ncbi:MAG: hypothetical protein CMA63_00455 [Euryarchaeota archaeon]|mgnify:FL=1|nr:hypothetical protein [Euryarchaeota archaeon]